MITPLVPNVGAADWNALVPVAIVALCALVILALDLVVPKGLPRAAAVPLAIVGLGAAAFVALGQWGHPVSAFGGMFVLGGFSIVLTEVILVATAFSLLLFFSQPEDDRTIGAIALMLWGATGAMLMTGAANLMTIFLGLELLSLALYCLCALAQRATARESALKYLILSSMASGFLLYGMALLFGASGSVALGDLANADHRGALFLMGTGLFLIGLAFKLSLIPFHVWTPDVYEGAPLAVTAFMSVVTKAGVLAVLARFLYDVLHLPIDNRLVVPLWIIAALSMLIGNLAALAQTDLKRLLAYSGIAQVGYIVAALAGGTAFGLRYALFYLIAYTFMNIGAFAVIGALSRESDEGAHLPLYAGLARRKPVLAGLMAFFLLGLAGLPPTAGFTGKVLILASQVGAGYAWLALVLIIGTAISLYAYFKIIRLMVARVDEAHVPILGATSFVPWLGVAVCAIAVLVLGLDPLMPHDVLPLLK